MVLIRGMNDDGSEPPVSRKAAVARRGKAEVEPVAEPEAPKERKPKGRILPWRKLDLIRELAEPKRTQRQMAADHGVTEPAITLFKQRHALEIARVRENMADKFAGLWVADKMNRIAVYEADIEAIEMMAQRDGATMAQADMLRVKGSFLRAVAEELGQLPARVNVTVTPVEHVIIGVNPEDLK